MEQEKPSNKLKMPEGVAPSGPVMDLAEAYMRAVVALPEVLEELVTIADSLYVLAVYAERRGRADGILSDEDLVREADDDKGPEPA